ncbi:MAG: monosaccharide transporter substrate-binding protein family [Nocardioides sp.]|uniref:hypothetical protein n=1 Tax=Nocardioides sp. TaxID=35761 RepID=UPI0026360B40|nr:hypothetical protein [Nocardioides sp.]MCW2832104.1 monosaccharide transporter substrate-binding protein family [Nocardioides sp.]
MKKQILSALCVRLRRQLAVVAVLLPLALAACSSPGDSSSASSSGGSEKGEVSQAATDTVEKFKAVGDFVSPGPAVDVASLAGKSVFVIPLLTTNDYNIQINAAMERVAELADVDFEVYTNEGQPNQWVAGMNQASRRASMSSSSAVARTPARWSRRSRRPARRASRSS